MHSVSLTARVAAPVSSFFRCAWRGWLGAGLVAALPGLLSAAPEAPATPPDEGTAERPAPLAPVVVTSSRPLAPLQQSLDTNSVVQPVSAHDGADLLRAVPGIAVIRKGGIDGDPVLRGMAGSRLPVLLDGQCVLGGCGNRMDPPTAYVFPSAFDELTVIKGPQTVLYGPGNSAGVVLFASDTPSYPAPNWGGRASTTVGAFGRFDASAQLTAGAPFGYGRLHGAWSQSDDYEDGEGRAVASAYERWATTALATWTLGRDATRLRFELAGALSDGEASYADRAMDGVKFARENVSLRALGDGPADFLRHWEASAYYNYVDHVMDNFSRRPFVASMMMPTPTSSNPDRLTFGGRLRADWQLADGLRLRTLTDAQRNEHTVRNSADERVQPYTALARMSDGEFEQWGLAAELEWQIAPAWRWTSGLRADFWSAQDERAQVRLGMMSMAPNPTAQATRDDTLWGGFTRLEWLARDGLTLYAGLGRAARFPDFWELFPKESTTTVSAFLTDPEVTTQLDVGALWTQGAWRGSLSLFTAEIDDYILIVNNFSKSGMMGTRQATVSRNVEAATVGGEAQLGYQPATGVQALVTVAWVRGENETDDRPLAQMPPLDARLELGYRARVWSVGALARWVAEQDRVAVGQGNIVGQDIGPSDSFATLGLHGAWQPLDWLRLSAGVDNLFDETYAEHISRAGAMVPGYTQTTRLHEPGRTVWLRADVAW